MPRPVRSLLALALALPALGVGACGSDDGGTIPQDDADELLATLSDVEDSVPAGNCTTAETDATQFVSQVDLLPKEVGVETKAQLFEGGRKLIELTQDQCEEPDQDGAPPADTGATGASGFEDG